MKVNGACDTAFANRYGSQRFTVAHSIIQNLMVAYNNVSGTEIYYSKTVRSQDCPPNPDPFQPGVTNPNPSSLMDDLQNWGKVNADIPNADMYILFTNRDINGYTIGVGIQDACCGDKENSYSLIQTRDNTDTSSNTYVANEFGRKNAGAHEIGHQAGTDHPDRVCAGSWTSGFKCTIMWARWWSNSFHVFRFGPTEQAHIRDHMEANA